MVVSTETRNKLTGLLRTPSIVITLLYVLGLSLLVGASWIISKVDGVPFDEVLTEALFYTILGAALTKIASRT